MSVYEKPTEDALVQTEINLYGSSRLGILAKLTKAPEPVSIASGYGDAKLSTFTRGERTFELSNHLGNVLATITDQKIQQTSDNTTVSYYTATVTTANDYYPFGMMMPGRRGYMLDQASGGGWSNGSSIPQNASYNSRTGNTPLEYKASVQIEFVDGFESGAGDEFVAYITEGGSGDGGNGSSTVSGAYRYGFNGQERSDEINDDSYTAEFWQYDSRIGRRWNVDPKPNESISVYNAFAGNPIFYSDHSGDTSSPSFASGFMNFVSRAQSGQLQKEIVIGGGKAGKDAVVGAYNFVTNDAWKAKTYSNLGQLILTLGTFDKPDEFRQAIDQTFQTNLQSKYTDLREKFDVTKWSAQDWSYNLTSLAIAVYGPKVVKDFKSFRVPLANSEHFINLASKERTAHILAGDVSGGGHAWFGSTKSFTNGILGLKSMFPASWSNAKIMHAISDVTVNNAWVQKTGKAGEMFTKKGKPVRFEVIGQFEGRTIKVVTTHTDIITAYPLK